MAATLWQSLAAALDPTESAAVTRRLLERGPLSLREACEAEFERMVLDATASAPGGQLVSAPPPAEKVAALYAVASSLAADPIERLQLESEAIFIAGRASVARATADSLAAKRRADGSRGGRPKAPNTHADEHIRAVWEREVRIRNGKARGLIKYMAARLGMTTQALSQRLRSLGLR